MFEQHERKLLEFRHKQLTTLIIVTSAELVHSKVIRLLKIDKLIYKICLNIAKFLFKKIKKFLYKVINIYFLIDYILKLSFTLF